MTRVSLIVAAWLIAGAAQAAEPRSRRKPPPPAPPPPASAAPAPRPPETTVSATTAEAPMIERVLRRGAAFTLAVGAHLDDGTMRGQDRRSVQITDETFEFANDNKLFVGLGVLAPLGKRLRAGAELRYFGSYDYDPEGGDTQGVRVLGQLAELAGRAEAPLTMLRGLDLVLGAQAGVAVLFPGGDFEEEIQSLQDQGAGVWNVPRLGYLVGPRAGVRWLLGERLSLRADFDVLWTQTFLFMTDEEVAGVAFEKSRRANVIRYQLGLGIELAL